MVAGSTTGRMGLGARLFLTLFFCIFLGIGLLVFLMTARSIFAEAAMGKWPRIPCTVISSSFEVGRTSEGAPRYSPVVRFRWDFGGRTFEGGEVPSAFLNRSDAADAQKIVNRFPAGRETHCRVDPEDSGHAVLDLHPTRYGYSLVIVFIPLLFVGVGAAGIWGVWGRSRSGGAAHTGIAGPAAKKKLGPGGQTVLFGILTLSGAGLFWGTVVVPYRLMQSARTWTSIPCTVLQSEVVRHRGSKGRVTWSAEILYSYEYGGQEYRSNRFGVLGGSSSDRQGMLDIVARYPRWSRSMCWVDPANPNQALLDRDWNVPFVLPLFAGGLLLVGVCGFVSGFRKLLQKMRGSSQVASVPGFAPLATSCQPAFLAPAELKPSMGPVKRILLCLLIAFFWNAIVSVFVGMALHGWQKGEPDLVLTVFLLPFLGIGLFLVGLIPWSILALTNPRVHGELHPPSPVPGEPVVFRFRLEGRTDRIHSLKVECVERPLRREAFPSKTLLWDSADHGGCVDRGEVTFPFPASDPGVSRILRVNGEIPLWPDVETEFAMPGEDV